ncbi:MAG: RNA methyltransferase [bacterium]
MAEGDIIESVQNKRVKELAALSTKKARRVSGHFVAEGARLVREAIFADSVTVHRVAIQADRAQEKPILHIIAVCIERKIPILYVNDQVMAKISRMDTSQGALAELSIDSKPTLADADFSGPTILAHGIQDPRNMGLLMRTAEAAGVTTFFASARATDPFHPTALQTSMGAAFHQKVIADADSFAVIEMAKKKGIPVFGTAVRNGMPANEWLETAPDRFLLALGNEGAGLETDIARLVTRNITLPMWGKTESLNVAVAAGVFLYIARLASEKRKPAGKPGKK